MTTRLLALLGNRAALFGALRDADALPPAAAEQQRMLRGADDLAQRWPELTPAAQATMVHKLLRRIELHPERLELQVDLLALHRILVGVAAAGPDRANDADQPSCISISVPARLRRSGKEIALVVGEEGEAQHAKTPLARLVAKAHLLTASLTSGEVSDLDALARREGVGRTYLVRMLRLAYLAPAVVQAILTGREPAGLTVNQLMKAVQLPLAWQEQRRVLGLS